MATASWKVPFHQARRFLAKAWLKVFPNLKIVGITGSYGKTNTTRAIAQVLSQRYKTFRTDLDLDTIYNLPVTILKLRLGHQVLVLEYGVDNVGEMDFHLSLVRPQIGVLTGISPVHSDPELLGSLEGIIAEKGKLLKTLPDDGWAILNHDDEQVREMAKQTSAKLIWYGKSLKCDYWADQIKIDLSGTSFTLHHGKKQKKIKFGLVGKHFVHSSLAAAAVGQIYGMGLNQIAKQLEKLTPLPGRMSVEKGPSGTILLNDSLRANPASTMAGLETLSQLPCQGRKVAVLGEMGELGKYAKGEHRKVGKKVASLKIDFLVAIGPLQKLTAREAIKAGMAKNRVFPVKDVFEAAQSLKKILKKGDIFYLKASLLRHVERVIFLLEGKKVDCHQISCHEYENCQSCPRLRKNS